MLEYFSLFIGIIGPNSPAASNNEQTLAAQGAKRRWSWRQRSGRVSLLNRRARGRFFSRYRRGTKSTFTKEVFGVLQIKEHLNVRDLRRFAKVFEE